MLRNAWWLSFQEGYIKKPLIINENNSKVQKIKVNWIMDTFTESVGTENGKA